MSLLAKKRHTNFYQFMGYRKQNRKFQCLDLGGPLKRSMQLITGLLLFFAGVQATTGDKVDDKYTIPLCCPSSDWKLVQIPGGPLGPINFACVTQDINEETTATPQYETQEKWIEDTSPVYGLGIRRSEDHESNSSIPLCENPFMNSFSRGENINIAFDSCLMGHGRDKIISISCSAGHGSKRPIAFTQKCCPHNFYYDSGQHKCVPNRLGISNFHLYQPFFKTAVIFNDNSIDCPRDRVLVEYKLNQFKFSLSNGSLHLRPLNKVFKSNQYCIEAVDNMSSSSSELEQEYLVRVCDEVATTCRRMACIRRCCNDGEMFSKGNATSYCRRDESDTTYHSFESLEISGNFTKPPVFGILRSLDCRKYRLDPDVYADEAHTISDRDGSLFVAATRKHYTNNQYCVEKIRNATWADQKLYTFLCFDSKVVGNDRIRFKLYTIGLLISCSFYAATLVVYLSISRLRNLPGKILICLVSSLFTAYLGIALGQLMPTPNETICFASGFFIYFCLMAAFSWMNVTCFDIWQTFGITPEQLE